MRARPTLLFLLSVLGAATPAAAQDSTEAERLYLEARRSEDRGTQLLGERWYGLVKLQEWNDHSGKHTINAKYVEHDPSMKWVKLRAVKGSGEGRVMKDLTIPMEKLDPRCQSRVRQIAKVEGMVTDSLAAAEVKEKEDKKDDPAGDRSAVARDQRVAAATDAEPATGEPADSNMATDPMPAEVPDIEAMAMQAMAMQVGIELVSPQSPLGIPATLPGLPSTPATSPPTPGDVSHERAAR
jgi:hypothetical protein